MVPGSLFALTLPAGVGVATESSVTDRELVPTALRTLNGLDVLVVDDEPEVREAMRQLLSGWGCHCRIAADLSETLAHVRQRDPDVLVTDYRLREGVTGGEVVRAVRRLARNPLRCIIVTGDTAPDRLRDAHDADALLLHKPVPATQLYRALAEGRDWSL